MVGRYIDRPRERLASLRADLDLSSYDGYSDNELARALSVTKRVVEVFREISERERRETKGNRSSGILDRTTQTFDRFYRAIRGKEAQKVGYTGILATVGKREFEEAISTPMEDVPPILPKNNVPFLDHGNEYIIAHLQSMARSGPGEIDGAYCFDLEGNLYDAGRRIVTPADFGLNGTSEEIRKIKGSLGTKHEAAAFASKNGLISIALSGEVGTVIALVGGKVIPSYTYISPEAERLRVRYERIRNYKGEATTPLNGKPVAVGSAQHYYTATKTFINT